jgi:hypothetical protein
MNAGLKGLKSALTPGMQGTGGLNPSTDPLGLALHQRAQQQEDEFYQQQHAQDAANADIPLSLAHQTEEAQNRIHNMNAGGWGDWLYAFNEATGGKGRFGKGTTFTDEAPQTFAPGQDSAVNPHAAAVGMRAIIDRRDNPQYYTDPGLSGISQMLKGKKVQA